MSLRTFLGEVVGSSDPLGRLLQPLSPGLSRKRLNNKLGYERLRLADQRVQEMKAELSADVGGVGRLDAAQRNRQTGEMPLFGASADAMYLPDQPTVLARARSARLNDWVFAAIANAYRRNVVGEGIMPRSQACQPGTDRVDDQLAQRIDEDFLEWASDPSQVDVEGRKTLAEFEGQWVEELVFVGGHLVIESARRDAMRRGDVGLALQGVEIEQLSTLKDTGLYGSKPKNGAQIRNGVELDAYGRAVAYHLQRHGHAMEAGFAGPDDVVRVLADQVWHFQRQIRVLETLSPSWLCPIILDAFQRKQYARSELIAKRIEAFIAFVIETDAAAGPMVESLGKSPDEGFVGGSAGDYDNAGAQGTEYREINFQGDGQVAMLNRGEKLKSFHSQRPGAGYVPYMDSHIAGHAAGAGLTPSLVTGKFEGTYVNGRMSTNENRKGFGQVQRLMIDQLLRPIRRRFIEYRVLQGHYKMPGFFEDPRARRAYLKCDWQAPEWYPIDEVKTAAARKIELDSLLIDRGTLANRAGRSERDVYAEIQRSRETAGQFGLELPELADEGGSSPGTRTGAGGDGAGAQPGDGSGQPKSPRELSENLVQLAIGHAVQDAVATD